MTGQPGIVLGIPGYLVPWGQSGTSWVCDMGCPMYSGMSRVVLQQAVAVLGIPQGSAWQLSLYRIQPQHMYVAFLGTLSHVSTMVDMDAASCLYSMCFLMCIVSFQIIKLGILSKIFMVVLDHENIFTWNNKTQRFSDTKISKSTVLCSNLLHYITYLNYYQSHCNC